MNLRDRLSRDTVKALRVHEPVTIGPEGTVGEAINLMKEHGAGCVVVTDGAKPVGMFTERDVLTKAVGTSMDLGTSIAEVMTKSPRVIEESCPIEEVIRLMHRGGFRNIPLVDSSGSLQGIVSVKRVVEYLVEYFPSAVFNLPPEPVPQQFAREGA